MSGLNEIIMLKLISQISRGYMVEGRGRNQSFSILYPLPSTKNLALIMLLLVFIPFIGQAQSQHELETKRQSLLEEIKKTDKELKQTKAQKASALEEFLALQSQIKVRQKLLNTLSTELNVLDRDITRSNAAIEALNEDMERLTEEYGQMAKAAYREKMSGNMLLFVLSAQSFNDAMKRWRYIKQYEAYRQKQAKLIAETKEILTRKIEKLERDKNTKEKAINIEKEQKTLLSTESSRKNKLVKQLKSDEIALVHELDQQKRREEELEKAIERIIAEEVRRSRALARNRKREGEASSESSATYFGDLAANFASSKGKLTWPVSGGTIVKGFGRHQHPKYKNVVTQNNGIDIKCDSRAKVRSIFSGKVSHRQFVPGNKNMVIIAHDNFYSVYANLEIVAVNRDQSIKKGQLIGELGSSKSVLHFEIWRDQTRLNPVEWIARR